MIGELTDEQLIKITYGQPKLNYGPPAINPVPFEHAKKEGKTYENGVVPPTPEWHTAEARKRLPIVRCEGDLETDPGPYEMTCTVKQAVKGHDIVYLWVINEHRELVGRSKKLTPE